MALDKHKTEAYCITALSNMHVGSGDNNFGTIDKLVQRDATTSLPVIHASSLKGALREFFEHVDDYSIFLIKKLKDDFKEVKYQNLIKKVEAVIPQKKISEIKKEIESIPASEEVDSLTIKKILEYLENALTRHIFGSNNVSKVKQGGEYNFFEADLISIPVRSNRKPFFRATSSDVIRAFLNRWFMLAGEDVKNCELYKALEQLAAITVEVGKPLIFENLKDVILEDYPAGIYEEISKKDYEKASSVLGENIALFHSETFKNLAGNEKLPVIARNHLENGESQNLWYEEVVPRESRFVFFISRPENKQIFDNEFDNLLKNKVVQIGANATIGYGFSKITLIAQNNETNK